VTLIPRRLGYAALCLRCDTPIEPDERAYVERGVGAWHEDCDEPPNLRLYQRERDRGPKLRKFRKYTDLD
jgi:hypothetical protein